MARWFRIPTPAWWTGSPSFLDIGNIDQYNAWLDEAQTWSTPAREKMLKSKGHLFTFWETTDLDGWQQFIVHARDRHGDAGDGLHDRGL